MTRRQQQRAQRERARLNLLAHADEMSTWSENCAKVLNVLAEHCEPANGVGVDALITGAYLVADKLTEIARPEGAS